MQPLPKDRFIEVEGQGVRYWEAGSGPPLLLLHGLGNSVQTWRHNVEPLGRRFRVLALDLPGHGLSDMPRQRYDLAAAVRFVAAFMEYLGLDRVHVVGNSMGGIIALELALRHPERVASLILVDSAGLGKEVASFLRIGSLPGVGEYFERPRYTRFARVMRSMVFDPAVLDDEIMEEMFRYRTRKGSSQAVLRFLRVGVSVFGQRPSILRRDALGALRVPLLVVWGRQDPLFPPSHAEAVVAEVLDSSLHLIDRCGHWPQVEHPEEFNRTLLEFLSGLNAGGDGPHQVSGSAHAWRGGSRTAPPEAGIEHPSVSVADGVEHTGFWLEAKHIRIIVLLLIIGVIAAALWQRSELTDFESLIDRLGYPAIFVLSLSGAGAMVLPLPSTAAVFFAGDILTPVYVGLIAGLGEAIGEITGYGLGFSGQGIVKGSRVYRKIEGWVQRRGWLAILIFSIIPNPIFDLLGIAAGVLRYPLGRFLIYAWMGKTIKNVSLAYAGFLGADWVAALFGVG